MYDYVVVGGGIESLLFCFLTLSKPEKSNIAFVTKSPSDMSEYSSLSKVGVRHVSTFEYINFLSRFCLSSLTRKPFLGGSNGISKALNKYEIYWLKKRLQIGSSSGLIEILDQNLKKSSWRGLYLWKNFLSVYPELFSDVDLIRGIYRISNQFESGNKDLSPLNLDDINNALIKGKNVFFEDDAFCFNSLKFCKKLAKFLGDNGIDFFYDTEISKINFTQNKKLEYVVSSCGKVFEGKNYFFSLGSNFFGYNDYFDLKKVTQPIAGLWFLVDDVCLKYPVKYCHYINSDLALYQSYTPLICKNSFSAFYSINEGGTNAVIVGTGCMWIRLSCQKSYLDQAFIENNKKVIRSLFPGKQITLLHDKCIRNFSYNCLPIFREGESLRGKYLSISGSGAFTTAAAVSSAHKAIQFFESNS